MMRCLRNPFRFGCTYAKPHGISKLDATQSLCQLRVQGMESICEIRYYLAFLLLQCGPSHVLVFIVINKLALFLNRVHKKSPSGLGPIYSRFLCGNFLPVSFPPMFDMGESLEEYEGDLFPVEKIVNKEITF
jgi:hypothetical protein